MKKKDLGFIAYDAADDTLMFAPIWIILGLISSVVAISTIKTEIFRYFFSGSVLSLADMEAQWLANLSTGNTILLYIGIVLGIILIFAVGIALFYGLTWLVIFIKGLLSKN